MESSAPEKENTHKMCVCFAEQFLTQQLPKDLGKDGCNVFQIRIQCDLHCNVKTTEIRTIVKLFIEKKSSVYKEIIQNNTDTIPVQHNKMRDCQVTK